MTKQEVNKLLALMKANYSYAFKNMSQQDKHLLLNTWAFTLQDLNADVVMIAAMQLISTSKWLPTVADIREKCKELHYSASFGREDAMQWAIDEGLATQEQITAFQRREQTRQYIANATNHLRGDTDKSAELTLDNILGNPAFRGLGAGQSGFAMLGEAQLELSGNDGRDTFEQGVSDRQSGRGTEDLHDDGRRDEV
jgi:hypothetical protein